MTKTIRENQLKTLPIGIISITLFKLTQSNLNQHKFKQSQYHLIQFNLYIKFPIQEKENKIILLQILLYNCSFSSIDTNEQIIYIKKKFTRV